MRAYVVRPFVDSGCLTVGWAAYHDLPQLLRTHIGAPELTPAGGGPLDTGSGRILIWYAADLMPQRMPNYRAAALVRALGRPVRWDEITGPVVITGAQRDGTVVGLSDELLHEIKQAMAADGDVAA